MQKTAHISDCENYRWILNRKWEDGKSMAFVLLNPSTADHENDDPTLRRCIGFAKREGCGSLTIVNLFAYRSSKPADLKIVEDPIGAENDHYLEQALNSADIIVCGWGGFPMAEKQSLIFKIRFHELGLYCLGLTQKGAPKHPLYLKQEAPIIPY